MITFMTIKNCFVKCGFSIDHVGSDDGAVKLTGGEEDDWHSLHLLEFSLRTTQPVKCS
jgi:hypothetical protein